MIIELQDDGLFIWGSDAELDKLVEAINETKSARYKAVQGLCFEVQLKDKECFEIGIWRDCGE